MKYFVLLHTTGVGGVWSVVKESLPFMARFYQVHVIIFVNNNDILPLVSDFFDKNFIQYSFIHIKSRNGWEFDLKRFFSLKQLNSIIGSEPAIIHSHDSYISSSYLPFLRSKNRYLFCTFHGTLIKSTTFSGRIQYFINRYVRIPLLNKNYIHFISCDPYSVSEIQKYFGANLEINVAVNGVSSSSKKTSTHDIFTIGYVSRFHPLKNWHLVAESCDYLYKQGYRIKVIFAGTGECEDTVKEWCQIHSDFAVYMGYSIDVKANILPLIDLHILPTQYPEGLPMILLECMAMGIPSLTTNVGSCSYAIRDCENGFIIDPCNEAIISAIKLLYHNKHLYDTLSHNCFQIWHDEFSSESMTNRYKAIFESFIKG